MKLSRKAIVTVVYDTEHKVRFERSSPSLVTSRSASTSIVEAGGGDRGFLWRLNSYWTYRQHTDGVRVDVLALSLSRDVPLLMRPIAGPIIGPSHESPWPEHWKRFESSGKGLPKRSAKRC